MAVTIDWVKTTLGGKKANDIVSLCTDSSINPYSIKCPIDSSYIDLDSNNGWVNSNYGWWIPGPGNSASVKSYVNSDYVTVPSEWAEPTKVYTIPNIDVWKRKKPQGGQNSPYRLGDFNGYSHSTASYDKILSYKITTDRGTFTAGSDILAYPDGNMTFTIVDEKYSSANFDKLYNSYFGVIAIGNSHTNVIAKKKLKDCTGIVKIGNDLDAVCKIGSLMPDTESYKLLPIVSTVAINTPTNITDNVIYLFPFKDSKFAMVIPNFTLEFSTGSYSAGVYDIRYTVKNNSTVECGAPSVTFLYSTTSSTTLSSTATGTYTTTGRIPAGGSSIVYFKTNSTASKIYFKIKWVHPVTNLTTTESSVNTLNG